MNHDPDIPEENVARSFAITANLDSTDLKSEI
jgi:hypothetical protein